MTYKILFLTDRGERHQLSALKAAPQGFEVIMRRAATFEELRASLPSVDFLISERNQPISALMIAYAPRLKLIVRLGSLLHGIDVQSAQHAGIRISMQPVMLSIFCAEHALMMILGLVKRLPRSLHRAMTPPEGRDVHRTDENVFAFNWFNFTDIQGLIGKTVAVLGMGEIGVELVRRLRPHLPGEILYTKRTPYGEHIDRELGVTYASMDDCLRRADIIVNLLPYGHDTDYRSSSATSALTAEKLSLCKPTALLVSLGSGSVIDESAVASMIENGRLAGVALDTYEYEPLQSDHPLALLARDPERNILLTPHTAAAYVSQDRNGDYGEIVRFVNGLPLQYMQH